MTQKYLLIVWLSPVLVPGPVSEEPGPGRRRPPRLGAVVVVGLQ